MKANASTAFIGFLVLFTCYHAAEYMIVFKDSMLGFFSFQILFFVAAYAIAKWQYKQGLAAWGLDGKGRWLLPLLLGMLMGIFLYGLTYLTCLFLGIEKLVQLPGWVDIIAPLSLFLFGNFFSSFSEDVLTRGYVYKHLKGKINSLPLVIVSAAVYLLNHIYRLGDGFVTYTYLFLLGVMFVTPLLFTKRLWFTGGMHWMGNVTFFFTHEIIKTEDMNERVSPNVILIVFTLLFLPMNYLVIRAAHLKKGTNAK